VVRLLGDDRQLSAVESGGALRLVAHDTGAVQLTSLYRFRDPAEAAATLKLRTGDASGLDFYLARGRIRSGSREAMAEAAYAGWRADMLAGKTTLMTAASGGDVTTLSAQARAERVEAGQVEPDGVALRDGTTAGRGDWIVTRQNNRRLGVLGGRDWVKNGDAWRVIKRYQTGALRVEHLGHRGCVTLPADYVAGQVQLLYATTAHRAQGTTVDTAHALITPEMSREGFYVAASRAREKTIFYTATHDLLPVDEDQRLDASRTDPRSYAAREVLENVLAREGAELSATETIRAAQDQAESLAMLVPRYMHAAQLLADGRYQRIAADVMGADDGRLLVADPAWGAVVRALQEAEIDGWEPRRLLAEVVGLRELGTARSSAEVIAWRIEAHAGDRAAPPRLAQPSEADVARYAEMVRGLPGFGEVELDLGVAVQPPAAWVTGGSGKRGSAREMAAAEVVRRALGPQLGTRVRAERAWPALEAALLRARRSGHDPGGLLDRVARSRELGTARSISEVLAWRIGTHLATGCGPGAESGDSGARRLDPQAWAGLAWMLKAAENNGCDLAAAVASVSAAPDAMAALFSLARAAARQRGASSILPWVNGPVPLPAGGAESDREVAGYLNAATEVISKRVCALAADAARARPAWVQAMGSVADDHEQYEEWLRHIEVVTAYRDQYQVTSDDPRQVLGPYAEPGHAGHRAYWHAAESVLAARTIAGLERLEATRREVFDQLAADIYRGLPEEARAVACEAMAEKLGPLWFGARGEADDRAATWPVYASRLVTALTEQGHLTEQMAVGQYVKAGVSTAVVTSSERPVEAASFKRLVTRSEAQRERRPQNSSAKEAKRRTHQLASLRNTPFVGPQPDDHQLPCRPRNDTPNQPPGPTARP
jgi:hypothetical protein